MSPFPAAERSIPDLKQPKFFFFTYTWEKVVQVLINGVQLMFPGAAMLGILKIKQWCLSLACIFIMVLRKNPALPGHSGHMSI